MSSKRYKDKFRFVPEPGEEVVRTWFHYVVSKTSEGQWVARTFYPETGRLTDLTSYADENCTIRSGRTFHWFDDGSEAYSGEFDGDLRVGVWSERSDSGRYEQGKREGVWRLPSSKSGRERGLLEFGPQPTASVARSVKGASRKAGWMVIGPTFPHCPVILKAVGSIALIRCSMEIASWWNTLNTCRI